MGTKTLVATLDNGHARCQTTTASGRQCLLAVHQDSVTHKYVNRDKNKPALSTLLPAGFTLTASEVSKDNVIKKSASRKDTSPRDEYQKRADADAKRNYAKNHGKHNADEPFENFIHAEYEVPPRAVDAVLDILRRAAGTGGTVRGSVLRYRQGAHASGNVRIQFAYVDKAPAAPPSPVAPKQ